MRHTVPSAALGRPVFAAVDAVVSRAASRAGVTVAALRGPCRVQRLVRSRWAIMLVLHEAGLSGPRIGRQLRRDHKTVHHGIEHGKMLRALCADFAETTTALAREFAPPHAG